MKPSILGVLFLGNFQITDSVSWLVIGLFIFFISSLFSLGDCTFLGIHPFHLGHPFYWQIFVHSSLFDLLYFSGVGCNFFIFDLTDLGFFPWWVWIEGYPRAFFSHWIQKIGKWLREAAFGGEGRVKAGWRACERGILRLKLPLCGFPHYPSSHCFSSLDSRVLWRGRSVRWSLCLIASRDLTVFSDQGRHPEQGLSCLGSTVPSVLHPHWPHGHLWLWLFALAWN